MRWHSPSCVKPDIIIESGQPCCQACGRAPVVAKLIANQGNANASLKIQQNEPLEDLLLRWPPAVKYTEHGGAAGRTSQSSPLGSASLDSEKSLGASTIYPQILQPSEFRLLLLHPSLDKTAPLHVTLEAYANIDCPEYEAASYTWGGETNETALCVPVYVGPFWDILLQTKNCAALLRYARRPKTPRFLWVDALCINQLSNVEKATQIPKMATIYRECTRVLAFLGEMTGATTSKVPHRNFPTRQGMDVLVERKQRSQAFLQCRYFSRLWIIQELVLPRQILFAFQDTEYWVDRATMQRLSWPHDCKPALWLRTKLAQQSFGQVTLLEVMETVWSSSQSADIRDKIFGILALLDANDANLLQPDYTLSVLHVFIGLTAHAVLNLEVATDVVATSVGIQGWDKQPSWVPDWSDTNCWPLKRKNLSDYSWKTDRYWHGSYELVPLPRCFGSVNIRGGLSLFLTFLFPLQHPVTYIKSHQGPDTHRFRTMFKKWTIHLISANRSLDKIVNPTTDHVFYMNNQVQLLMRPFGDKAKEYRIICPLFGVLLKSEDQDDEDSYEDSYDEQKSFRECYLSIDRILLEDASRTVNKALPFVTSTGDVSDSTLERIWPELRRRRDTYAAKRLRHQIFPGASTPRDTLQALHRAMWLSQKNVAKFLSSDDKDMTSANLLFVQRPAPDPVDQFLKAFYSVNKNFSRRNDPLRKYRGGKRDHAFVYLVFRKEQFHLVEAWYINTRPVQDGNQGDFDAEEEQRYGPKPLAWEWKVASPDDAEYMTLDGTAPDGVTKFWDLVADQDCIYLRTRLWDLLTRLLGGWWETEVMKRLSVSLASHAAWRAVASAHSVLLLAIPEDAELKLLLTSRGEGYEDAQSFLGGIIEVAKSDADDNDADFDDDDVDDGNVDDGDKGHDVYGDERLDDNIDTEWETDPGCDYVGDLREYVLDYVNPENINDINDVQELEKLKDQVDKAYNFGDYYVKDHWRLKLESRWPLLGLAGQAPYHWEPEMVTIY